jgi:hypothetical protein
VTSACNGALTPVNKPESISSATSTQMLGATMSRPIVTAPLAMARITIGLRP